MGVPCAAPLDRLQPIRRSFLTERTRARARAPARRIELRHALRTVAARALVARTEGKARERAVKRLQSVTKARAKAATKVAKIC